MNKAGYAFLHSFSHLLSSGCTAGDALELLAMDKSLLTISDIALNMINSLRKGETLGNAIINSNLKIHKKYYPYIIQFEHSGNINTSLNLIIESIENRKERLSRLLQVLIYPVLILLITSIFLGFLFFSGIPWMKETGLITDITIIYNMKTGTSNAYIFLFLSAFSVLAFTLLLLNKKQTEYTFWSMLISLTETGLTFDQSLDIYKISNKIPYKSSDEYYFFDSQDLDLFTRTSLMTARITGNFTSSFQTITSYKKKQLQEFYSILEKLADPVFTGITGAVLMIISVSVFLPVLNQLGAIK